MDPFKHEHYPTNRPRIIPLWLREVSTFLKLKHPQVPNEVIHAFAEKELRRRMVIPMVEILRHPTPGNTIRETVPLTTHLTRDVKNNIIAPSGSTYVPPTVKESFLKISLAAKVAERKKYKKIMLEAKEAGDKLKTDIYQYLQASTKIFVNSAPGAMNSPFNILYDKPGFNSITSISRMSVKYGYGHTERVVEGNLYLPDYEDVVSYCLRLHMTKPDTLSSVLSRYNLHIPSAEEVTEHLMESVKYYTTKPLRDKILSFIQTLPDDTRAFVLYAGCWKTLTHRNEAFFKSFLRSFFNTDIPVDTTADPKEIFKTEADMLAMITSVNYDLLGMDTKGNRLNLKNAVDGGNIQGAQHLLSIAKHMEHMISEHADLFSCFFRLESDLAKIQFHPNMVRRCVLVSDTDSVIFSTQSMIEWYSGEVNYSKSSYQINAFTVYLISRSLEHVFARLSTGFGMVGDDIKKISMKNEFLYTIMLRTTIKKHYAGIVQIQEGKLLPKPAKDIKGVQFRDSKLSAQTNKDAEAFLIDLLQSVVDNGKINGRDYLDKVHKIERKIYDSIMSGSRDYLKTVPVKPAAEYKNDNPMQTNYFYYELWSQVFARRFDDMVIPNKCYSLPLKNGGKCITAPEWLDQLSSFDKKMTQELLSFLEQSEKKSFSQLLIPPTMASVPEIFRPLIDVRSVIFTNCKPFYLALESIGFAYIYGKDNFLISDFYNPDNLPKIPYS